MGVPYPIIDSERCSGDGLCETVCPSAQIHMDPTTGKAVYVGGNRPCNACGQCFSLCPQAAITIADGGSIPRLSPDADQLKHWRVPEGALAALLLMRRSIRHFRSTQVSRELLGRAFEVIRYAPTASNRQRLQWIVIQNEEELQRLAAAVATWALEKKEYRAVAEQYYAGTNTILRDAPCVLLLHADAGYAMSAQDCGVALGYMELILTSLGLGSCWSGLVGRASAERPDLLSFLQLPVGNVLFGGLMVGYPRFSYRRPPQRKLSSVEWR